MKRCSQALALLGNGCIAQCARLCNEFRVITAVLEREAIATAGTHPRGRFLSGNDGSVMRDQGFLVLISLDDDQRAAVDREEDDR